ncbi:cytochrome P450/oxidoreductase [Planktotalea sp.]|uniref:cytochrome P450/oxidoreductase n=1 Tax=Planktotalea sp. TaxID=2029877 RepID=UPI003299A3EB
MTTTAPIYDVDFYSDDFIRDPHPHYAAMRALGPVVYIPSLENYALTQHAVVQDALRDHARFTSAKGVAGDKFGSDFLQGNTVASDPPRHTKLRRAMAPPLLPGALETIRPEVERVADTLIEGLVQKGSFDAISDLARHLPLKIVTEMVGLPDFGQDNMLKWAAAAFDVLGEQNERGKKALDAIAEMRAFIAGQVNRDTLKEGSWTYRILDLVDQGVLSAELAPFAIRDYINPSLDTTISATGQLVWQLSQNPDQWDKLRDNPDLCRNAVNEAVRLGTPIRSFSRHTTQDVEIAGVTIPQGSRVMMLFASANRDAAVFENPDQFDVTRDPKDHLGFGSGIHMCIGMHLAQLEMISLLKAMITRVGRMEVGTPDIVLNNTIAAFATLPTKFVADAREAIKPKATRPQATLIAAKVVERQLVAKDIVALTIEAADGTPLPEAAAGAHIDIHIRDGLVRQYSLTGDVSKRYQIAIQRAPVSRGGSIAMHQQFQTGSHIKIGTPRNNFALIDSAAHTLLYGGGIGLTPILAMAWQLHTAGETFECHLSARSRDRLAFGAILAELPFSDAIRCYFDDDARTSLSIEDFPTGSHAYVCGPIGYMAFVTQSLADAGLGADQIHVEHFASEIDVDGDPFEVIAQKSGITVQVGAQDTILEALARKGITVPTSCQNGVCGSCLTPVIEGKPDHRDLVMTDVEKASNKSIAVCCSRSQTRRLILDV